MSDANEKKRNYKKWIKRKTKVLIEPKFTIEVGKNMSESVVVVVDKEDQFKFVVAASICILVIIVQIILSFLWFFSKLLFFYYKKSDIKKLLFKRRSSARCQLIRPVLGPPMASPRTLSAPLGFTPKFGGQQGKVLPFTFKIDFSY